MYRSSRPYIIKVWLKQQLLEKLLEISDDKSVMRDVD